MNRTLRGWFEYFKHSHRLHVRAAGPLDPDATCAASCANGRSGRGRGAWCDHQRWPNAFFAEQGLFSLVAAHAQLRQSSTEVNHQLESRMREIRPSGSEGGGAKPIVSPYPYFHDL